MKLGWIGLRFRYPLLLHPVQTWHIIGEVVVEKEKKRWRKME
jgi:hypothetical protein